MPRRNRRRPASTAAAAMLLVVAIASAPFAPVDGAFLESKVPLRVVSVVPSDEEGIEKGPYPLRGRDALTVTFSRPIIALGSDYGPTGKELPDDKVPFRLYELSDGDNDRSERTPLNVPGKLRYPTTFLSRFDLDGVDWPPDLDFVLEVNPDLTSHDGLRLADEAGRSQVRYSTPGLTMHRSSIVSKKAFELSDGRWTSGGDGEVPPDGIATVRFSSDVDLAVVAKALRISKRDDDDGDDEDDEEEEGPPTLAVHPCGAPPESDVEDTIPEDDDERFVRCAQVTPRNLQVDTAYVLTLPSGTKYHDLAGPLRSDLTVGVSGLRPFSFRWTTESWILDNVSYRRWDLALPHGLADGVDVDDLKATLRVHLQIPEGEGRSLKKKKKHGDPDDLDDDARNVPVEFDATLVDKGTLRLHVPAEVKSHYTITVDDESGAVRDGFGLDLEPSSVSFVTADVQDVAFDLETNVVLERPPENGTWSFLGRGQNVNYVLTPVSTETVRDVLAMEPFGWSSKDKFSLTESVKHFPTMTRDDVDIPSNFFLRSTSDRRTSYYTSITDLYVATVKDAKSTTAWVLRYSDGSPVKGAVCSFFGRKGEDRGKDATDAYGTCSVLSTADYIHVDHDDGAEVAFAETSYTPPSTSRSGMTAVLITDRAVYKPGDTVYFKGYVRSRDAKYRWKIPKLKKHASVEARVSNNGKARTISAPFEVHQDYGSFHGTLKIPEDVDLNPTHLSLVPGDAFGGASAQIAIADPRRPTGSMEFEVGTSVCVPGRTVPLKVAVTTGTGAPVKDASVHVRWTHARQPAPPSSIGRSSWWRAPSDPIETKGSIILTTDTDGIGKIDLDLDAELRSAQTNSGAEGGGGGGGTEAGDRVAFAAEWVGPTGELVTRSAPELVVALSERSIQMDTTVPDPLPGFNFGVKLSVKDAGKDGFVETFVVVTLEEAPAAGGGEEGGDEKRGSVVATCDVNFRGDPDAIHCHDELKMPSVGKYVLRASAVDERSAKVETTRALGKTMEEWKAFPLNEFSGVSLGIDKEEYEPDDDVNLSFVNPFANAKLLVTWGNALGYHHKRLSAHVGKVDVTVSLDGIVGGCAVTAFLFAPRQTEFELPVQVPISKSWDFGMPRSIVLMRDLKMIDVERTVAVRIDAPASAGPGDEVDVVVTVTDPDGGRISASTHAEIAVVAVDEAYLQLKAHPLPKLNETFRTDVPRQLSYRDTVSDLVSPSGYEATVETAYRRYEADPWVSPQRYMCCESDLSDEAFFDQLSTRLTEFGGGGIGGGMVMGDVMVFDDEVEEESMVKMAMAPPPMVAMSAVGAEPMAMQAKAAPEAARMRSFDGAATNPTAAATVLPPLRTNFEVTPLFAGRIIAGEDGAATVSLKLPDSLGTYSLRAYAVDEDHRFGMSESKLVVKKGVNLQPMIPRVARTGDAFRAGVTLELDGACLEDGGGPGAVTVEAKSKNEVVSIVGGTKTLSPTGPGPHRVKFDMKAVSIGDCILEFFAKAEKCGEDAVEAAFPSLPLQDEVVVATSMAIAGSDGDDEDFVAWEEGIEFPPASPGSGKLTVTAGVGRLPSLEAFAATLGEYKYAGDYLSAVGLLASMGQYKGSDDDEDSAATLLANSFATLVGGLNSLTTELGLEWRLRDCARSYYSCHFKNVDAWLNANALVIAKRLEKSGGGGRQRVSGSLTDQWAKALTDELERRAADARSRGHEFGEWDLLARSYLALGPGFTKDVDLSVGKLVAQRGRLSQTGRLLLAHYLVANPKEKVKGIGAIVKETLHRSYNAIRVQGRTAYVGNGGGSQNALSLEAQGLALSLFMTDLKTYGDDMLVEKVANWVGRGNAQSSGSCRYLGYADMVFGSFGLVDYDAAKSATDPHMVLKADSGDRNVLTAKFDGPSIRSASATKVWSELPTVPGKHKPESLVFRSKGSGEASVAVELRFVPDRLDKDPVYRGIFVDKVIRLVDPTSGKAAGDPVQVVQSGSTVEVTVQMTTADDLRSVTLVDFVVAGLEPIDRNLGDVTPFSRAFNRWWYYTPFDNPETRPATVKWMASWVPAGTHSASYRAVAVTEGVFALSPSKAFADDQPELMGLSWAGSMVVTDDSPPSTTKDLDSFLQNVGVTRNSRLALAKDCPDECGLGLECNIATGACEAPRVEVPLFKPILGSGGPFGSERPFVDAVGWRSVSLFSLTFAVLMLMLCGRYMRKNRYETAPQDDEVEDEAESEDSSLIEMKNV